MAVSKEQLIIQLRTAGITLSKNQLKKLDAQVKTTTASMGGMGKMMAGVGFIAFGMAMKQVISTGKEFQQSMANVKAISGATAKEFKALEANARALGASTVFTAANVSELQTSFSKLGFTAKEIVSVTKGTLALASAVGSDLATSAATAGTTLRGFGLDVSETSRVTDVMALSFSSSALDMAKFSDSMKYVAPIAKLAGVSLEGTTAILGTLANAGIDGSMAGTSLRRILLEAGKAGSKLADRMGGPITSMEDFQTKLKKLREQGFDPLTEGADLVGKRAVTAFAIMLGGAGKTDKLTEALKNAGGAAQKMADIQLDTLEGDMRKLSSATDELQIKMFNLAEESLRNVTQGMTDFINSLDEGDILAYKKALEIVIGSLALYKLGMVAATLWTNKFAISITKTGIGAFAVVLGIAAAEAMKYFNVFETENDKLADATKEVDRYNKSVKEQAEILGGGAFTLDEAIDKYYQYETAVKDVDAQINMLNDDIANQESLLGDVSDVLGGGGFIIYDEEQFNIIQKTISETKGLRAELEKTKEVEQMEKDVWEATIAILEKMIEVKKEVAGTSTVSDGDTGTGVGPTDEQIQSAQDKLNSFYYNQIGTEQEILIRRINMQEAHYLAVAEIAGASEEEIILIQEKFKKQREQVYADELAAEKKLAKEKEDLRISLLQGEDLWAENRKQAIADVEEAEAEAHSNLVARHGEKMAMAIEFVEQQAEHAQMALDAMGGAVDAWEQKNAAEADIYRKKLDGDEKAELTNLKNSLDYKKASTKEKKKLEEDLADSQETIRLAMEKKIATAEWETATASWVMSIGQSIIDTSLAIVKALASLGPIAGPIMAGVVGTMGVVQTGLIIANKPVKPAQFGMNEVIDTPTQLSVAEAGPELVQVTPLGGDMGSPGAGPNINITFEGNVMSDDFIIDEAIPKIREAVLRGESLS